MDEGRKRGGGEEGRTWRVGLREEGIGGEGGREAWWLLVRGLPYQLPSAMAAYTRSCRRKRFSSRDSAGSSSRSSRSSSSSTSVAAAALPLLPLLLLLLLLLLLVVMHMRCA